MADLSPRLVECEHFSDAGKFLDALRRNRRWPCPKAWIYRGHGDSRWKLLPKIFRCGPFGEYRPKPREDGLFSAPTNVKQVTQEAQILHAFSQNADSCGLHVPGFDHFGKSQGINGGLISEWIPDKLHELAALAQHYGVPTRLLDWTCSPTMAAYFAAAHAANQYVCEGNKDGRLSVFGLYTGYLPSMFDGQITTIKAARNSNANVHAQHGVFTLDRQHPKDANEPPICDPLDKRVSNCGFTQHKYPLLRELALDWSQSSALLQHLHDEGITAATVFPGYEGAAQAADEMVLCEGWIKSNPSKAI